MNFVEYPGIAPGRRCVLSFSLFTPESGVDSAEADQVGRQGIRFCAYDGLFLFEGVRHYRTTLGALRFFLWIVCVVFVIAGCGSHRRGGPPGDMPYFHTVGMLAISDDSAAPGASDAGPAVVGAPVRPAHPTTHCPVSSSASLLGEIPFRTIRSLAGYPDFDSVFDSLRVSSFPLGPVQGLTIVPWIGFGDLLIHRY